MALIYPFFALNILFIYFMNMNKKDICIDVIQRLSSRIRNEQNQSSNSTIPFCIEKSFYQYTNDVGQEYCAEVCGNNCYPTNISSGCIPNPNFNSHQFTSANLCDNRNEYIDYIVTNVLSQVVNHIQLDSFNQLSCSLRNKIEDILCHTDMDSDRLIRMLVMDVLECYSGSTTQCTDWYAFANLMKFLVIPTDTKDQENDQAHVSNSQMSLKPKQLFKQNKNSTRNLSNSRPTSPIIKKELSSDSIAFDTMTSSSKEFKTPLFTPIHSPATTPKVRSVAKTMTPRSIQSKEETIPTGAKYPSKTKSNQMSATSEKDSITDHQQSLPFRDNPITLSIPNPPETLHDDQLPNTRDDESSSSDCVLTIHHKHKHKKAHKHKLLTTTTATSYHTPLSSPISIPIKEYFQKHKPISADLISTITEENKVEIKSGQNISFNAANIEQRIPCELLNEKQIALLNFLTSSNRVAKQLEQNENSLDQLTSEETVSPIPNLIELLKTDDKMHKKPTEEENSTPINRKMTRINHYPNMLADFD